MARCRGVTFGLSVTSMRSTPTDVATFQNTRVSHGPIKVRRPAIKADDGHLVGLRLHRLEHLGGEVGPRCLEHGVPIGREFATHDLVQLDRQAAQRVEQPVPAGSEHLLEPTVAHEEGALAVLHCHAQHHKVPIHNTSPSLAPRQDREAGLQFAKWGPDARLPLERRTEA